MPLHDDHFFCHRLPGPAGTAQVRTDTYRRSDPAFAGNTSLTFYGLTDNLNALATAHPTRCAVEVLAQTPASSQAHAGGRREIFLAKVGTNFNQTKPKILFTGGIHAREWIGPAYLMLVIEWLLENYPTTGAGTTPAELISKEIIDGFHLFIVPMCNPDSHEYTVTTNRFFRRNSPTGAPEFQANPTRRRQTGAISGAPFSVDVNRDFDTRNRAAIITSRQGSFSTTDPADDTFIRATPFASLEARTLRDLVDREYGPAANRRAQTEGFDGAIDYHSFGCFVMSAPGDDATALAGALGTRYTAFGAEMRRLLDLQAGLPGNVTSRPSTALSPRISDTWRASQASLFYTNPPFSLAPNSARVPGTMTDYVFYKPTRTSPLPASLCFAMELPPMHHGANPATGHSASPGFDLQEGRIRAVFNMVLPTSLAFIASVRDAAPVRATFDRMRAVP